MDNLLKSFSTFTIEGNARGLTAVSSQAFAPGLLQQAFYTYSLDIDIIGFNFSSCCNNYQSGFNAASAFLVIGSIAPTSILSLGQGSQGVIAQHLYSPNSYSATNAPSTTVLNGSGQNTALIFPPGHFIRVVAGTPIALYGACDSNNDFNNVWAAASVYFHIVTVKARS